MHADRSWMERGNCRSVETAVMFPTNIHDVTVAKQVCNGCPVKGVCLEYALDHRIDHGVWGGQSERARRKLARQRRLRRAS